MNCEKSQFVLEITEEDLSAIKRNYFTFEYEHCPYAYGWFECDRNIESCARS